LLFIDFDELRNQKHRTDLSSFPVQRSDLLDKIVDFLRRQFARVFGHSAFAIGDYVTQVLYRSCSRFFGDQRWSAEMGPSALFP
jgi:hypothetical protein